MISDENEYFLELLHTTETLIDSINFGLILIKYHRKILYFLFILFKDTPDSIELLQYMLEHVIELEADGHLTTPDANRIIGNIFKSILKNNQ